MQTNEQGDVILNIGANINKARTAINDLSRYISNVFKAFKGQTVSSPQLDKLNAQAEQSAAKIESLQAKIREMSTEEVASAQLEELVNELKEAEKYATELAQNKYHGAANLQDMSLDQLPNDFREAAERVNELENKIAGLVESGKAFTTTAEQQPQAFEKVNSELRQEQSNFSNIQSQINGIYDSGQTASSRVSKSFKSMGTSVVNAFRKIRTHAKSSSNSAADSFSNINKSIKKGITSIVKYGLGIRSLYVLFRKLRSAVVDTYKDLASYSDEVNQSVSNAKTAITTLKKSVSAAIQPLVSTFAPVVTSVASKLTSMVGNVGEFFAALTGQEYVYKAVNVQESYADALEDTADSASKASDALEGYLSPLDDINRYTDNSTSSSSDTSAADSAAKFTQTKVGGAFKDIADKVAGYFSDIFKPIKTAWDRYGKPVIREWNNFTDNIKRTVSNIANAFKNVWTNGSGENVTSKILKLWRSVLGVINGIIDTFNNAWTKDALGEQVIQSFIDRFSNLIGLIQTVADSFKEVWTSGTGERIWTNILSIVRNINDIIGGFWQKLTDAWSANNNGKKIWSGILGIVEDISEWLNDMSDITLDWVDDLDFSPLASAASTLVGTFRDLAKVVGGKLKTAYRDVLLPLAKWTIEEAVPTLIEWFASALKVASDIIDAIPVKVLTGLATGIVAVFAAIKAYKTVKLAWDYIKGLGTAFSGLWTTISAHPYAAAILAIVAALTAVVTAISVANETKWNTSDLKKSTDEINEYFDDVATAAQNMKDAIEDVNKSHIEIQADVSQVETLKDRLIDVIKNGIIDEEEMPEYETIINLLNKVDGFEEVWNNMDLQTINGEIYINADEATKALQDFTDEWKKTQWITALSEDYKSLYSSLSKNTRDLNDAETKVSDAYRNLEEGLKERISAFGYSSLDELGGYTGDVYEYLKKSPWLLQDSTTKELFESYENAVNSVNDYTSAQSKLNTAYHDNMEAQKFLNGETDNYVGALYAVDSGLISEADAFDLLKDTGISSYSQLQAYAERQKEAELNKNDEIGQSNSKLANEEQSQNEAAERSSRRHRNARISDSKDIQVAYRNDLSGMRDENDELDRNAQRNSSSMQRNYLSAFSGIRNGAIALWDTLVKTFTDDGSIGNSIGNFAISGVNLIIRGINSAIATICDLINGAFDDMREFEFAGITPFSWLPTLTNYPSIGEIPALAKGAVLPAGKPFVAMLGDQKNGRNLEAPEELIRKIVREETANTGPREYTIPVQIGSKTLFTLFLDEARLQQNEIGYNPLVKLGG